MDGEVVDVLISGSGDLPNINTLGEDLTEAFGTPVTVIVEFAQTEITTYSDAGVSTQSGGG